MFASPVLDPLGLFPSLTSPTDEPDAAGAAEEDGEGQEDGRRQDGRQQTGHRRRLLTQATVVPGAAPREGDISVILDTLFILDINKLIRGHSLLHPRQYIIS